MGSHTAAIRSPRHDESNPFLPPCTTQLGTLQAAAKSYSVVYANSTGLVDISSIKSKYANLTAFTDVDSYSKYAEVELVSDTTFQVIRSNSSKWLKTKVLVWYSAVNTNNGTTKGSVLVIFKKSSYKGVQRSLAPRFLTGGCFLDKFGHASPPRRCGGSAQ